MAARRKKTKVKRKRQEVIKSPPPVVPWSPPVSQTPLSTPLQAPTPVSTPEPSTISSTPIIPVVTTPSGLSPQPPPAPIITQQPAIVTPKVSEPENKLIEEPPSKSHIAIIVFISLIILALVGGAFFYIQKTQNKEEKKETGSVSPTPRVSPKVTESKTLTEEVDLSKYSISVLNGSDVKGEASKVKGVLEESDFNISSIGNADRSDYEKTVIKAKKEVEKEFLEQLKNVLKKSYSLSAFEELSDSEETDVVVIIGSKGPNAATPSEAPTATPSAPLSGASATPKP